MWPFSRASRPAFDPSLVQDTVAPWGGLSVDERERLVADASELASRLRWEAARGMELTDQVITTVASRAALLVLGRSSEEFKARTVVIHRSTVVLDVERAGPVSGTRSGGKSRLHGQADDSGLILLAWDAVTNAGLDSRWPYDVVLHEFAHSLDAGDGLFDGTPAIGEDVRRRWVGVATDRFDRLRQGSDPGVMRPYGATNTAEFFAVAVETLFARPHDLRAADPEFFEVLVAVVGVDPSRWSLATGP